MISLLAAISIAMNFYLNNKRKNERAETRELIRRGARIENELAETKEQLLIERAFRKHLEGKEGGDA
jgi:hypothetical protein